MFNHPASVIGSHLGMVLLEAPENAQSHVTVVALQLSFSFIIFKTFQTTFLFHCMMNATTIFKFTMNSQNTECTLYLGYDFVATIGRALFSCNCNGKAWHWRTKQRIFSPVSPEFPYFRFPIRLVNIVEYLKSVSKM
jgi:hypothetical protein